MKHVFKKILYYIIFIATAIALYLLVRRNTGTIQGVNGNITKLRHTNESIKHDVESAKANATNIGESIKSATNDNTTAGQIAESLTAINRRFKRLLQAISANPKN